MLPPPHRDPPKEGNGNILFIYTELQRTLKELQKILQVANNMF